MGRPKLESITERKWWKDNVAEGEVGPDGWMHLLWFGGGNISRFTSPRVNYDGGQTTARRAIWDAAGKEKLPSDIRLASACEHDACISPHHAVKLTASESAAAIRDAAANSTTKPWLLVGRAGNSWDDFSEIGYIAALIAYRLLRATELERNTKYVQFDNEGDMVFDVEELPGKQRLWVLERIRKESDIREMAEMIPFCLDTEIVKSAGGDAGEISGMIFLVSDVEEWEYPVNMTITVRRTPADPALARRVVPEDDD